MKLGLVGLPSSGKTTVLNAVTGAHGEVGRYHRGAEAGHAAVAVPDPRLAQLARIVNPKKITPATIEYIDVPGVMADAGKKEYVQDLAALREADALVHVVRFFEDPSAPHPRGSLEPARDAAEVHDELVIADLDIAEKRVGRINSAFKRGVHNDADVKELAILEKCIAAPAKGQSLAGLGLTTPEKHALRQFAFLTLKPMIFVLNVGEDKLGTPEIQRAAVQLPGECIEMCGKLEMEIAELEPEERKEFLDGLGIGEPASARLVRASYKLLGLRSFFTVVSDELKAWTIGPEDNALTAAGKIHSDIARGFIRAEVTAFNDLIACGSFKAAKDAGKLRLEGKEYPVQDGDIITFRFHV